MIYPKISIITPSFNQGAFLEQTILSILGQNYPNLEYIIIDGGSTDNSIDIIKKYESKLTYWVSEKDEGLYYALQKGFKLSTGDIMGWCNSDDMLHNKSLYLIAELLSLDGVEWIQGQPTLYDEVGRVVYVSKNEKWSKYRYFLNDYKYIQQESTYWTRNLWDKAGATLSTKFKYAGDLELWSRFFIYEKLYTPSCLIGGFRGRSKNQLSVEGLDKYHEESEIILKSRTPDKIEIQNLNSIIKLKKILSKIVQTKIFNMEIITFKIRYKINKLYDFPPDINFVREHQKFII